MRLAGLPRMRGDRPLHPIRLYALLSFTPHARGSTPLLKGKGWKSCVYPACAGIDLLLMLPVRCSYRLPRMRGDRPLSIHLPAPPWLFTPHARGSTVLQVALHMQA